MIEELKESHRTFVSEENKLSEIAKQLNKSGRKTLREMVK